MPIFEYKCTCGLRFEAVILDTKAPHETSVCPRCKGQGQKREQAEVFAHKGGKLRAVAKRMREAAETAMTRDQIAQ